MLKFCVGKRHAYLSREKKDYKMIFQILLNQKGRLFHLYGADFRSDINNYESFDDHIPIKLQLAKLVLLLILSSFLLYFYL